MEEMEYVNLSRYNLLESHCEELWGSVELGALQWEGRMVCYCIVKNLLLYKKTRWYGDTYVIIHCTLKK